MCSTVLVVLSCKERERLEDSSTNAVTRFVAIGEEIMESGITVDCEIDIPAISTKFADTFVQRLTRLNGNMQDVIRYVELRL